MTKFKPEEKRIIRTLYSANKPLTTKKISETIADTTDTSSLWLL